MKEITSSDISKGGGGRERERESYCGGAVNRLKVVCFVISIFIK